MKYKQLALGFVLGIVFAYGSYKVVHHIKRAGGLAAAGIAIGQPASADQNNGGNVLNFSRFDLQPSVKGGQVTIHYDFIPSNDSADVSMQIFLPVGTNWQQFTPADANGTIIFHLQQGSDTAGQFDITLPVGSYSGYRIILFNSPDGKNTDYGHTLYDSNNDHESQLPKLNFQITSASVPAGNPTIVLDPNPIVNDEGNGLSTVVLSGNVRYASNYNVEGGGFWVMAKGDSGFAQIFASTNNAVPDGDPQAGATNIPIRLVLKDVKPGLGNVQMGLFKPSWGQPLQWIWPGPYFEVGGNSWEQLAPETAVPPRLQVVDRKFELLTGTPYDFYRNDLSGKSAVNFVRGGNFGNAINWKFTPALDTPSYFGSLAALGCHYMRFNYNPDLYLEQRAYQDTVDQVVQNIWSAGIYPIIAPQDLPSGDSLAERVEKNNKLLQMVAERYSGRSVWIELCNEPHEFQTWQEWKPIAERYVKTIRAVDPNAFVIVPFEKYSGDGRGAAQSPITSTHVDLYDGHAYIAPTEVSVDFSSAIEGGLPVMIGEYGGTDGGYLHSMDLAFQSLRDQPLAISPWAFTIKGDDSLPLIQDGSSGQLVFTAAGQAISDDFSAWNVGRKVE